MEGEKLVNLYPNWETKIYDDSGWGYECKP